MKVHFPLAMSWLGASVAILPALFATLTDDESKPAAPTPMAATNARLDAAGLDAMFEEAWAAAGLKPAGPANDADWLRRATLTLNGTIPTADEVTAFLADRSKEKRAKKVDELLSRSEFGEFFGGEWTRRLIGREVQRNRFDRDAFCEWVEEQFNVNTPFNKFAAEVVTAMGTPQQNPAVGYIERWQAEPKDLAGQTSKAFLGVQMQCARCHDHKDQQWKQEEFNEFAAYFALTRLDRSMAKVDNMPPIFDVQEENDRQVGAFAKKAIKKRMEERLKTAKNPEAAQKLKERTELKSVDPTPLRPYGEGPFSTPLAVNVKSDSTSAPKDEDTAVVLKRRERLAAWMTAPGNPYFARSIVNTTFSQIFGYGLVNPVDDFRSDSTVAIPVMLDGLAREFEVSGYDFKALVKLMTSSKAFHLSSTSDPKEKSEVREVNEKLYTRFVSRPLLPEQIFDSMSRATGIDEAAEARMKAMPGADKKPRGKNKVKDGEPAMTGEKTAEMYPKIRQQALRKFITTFDDDEQGEDIDFEGTIPQALLMMNSKLVTQSLSRGYTVTRALDKGPDALDWIYLSVLSRKPSSDERVKASAYMQKNGGDNRQTCEDIAWALLNSAEFSTVH